MTQDDDDARTDAAAARKAETLIESLPWLKRFHGETIVVKFGGNAMVSPELQRAFAEDMVYLRYAGIKPVVVHGDGTGLWASCHVEDVAKGFVGAMGNEKCVGEAYNITGDEWMTWTTYHQTVAEAAGGTFDPVYIPTDALAEAAPKLSGGTREIFAWTSIFSNDKIKRDTGYPGQSIPFREGVARHLEHLIGPDAVLCLPTAPGSAPAKDAQAESVEVEFRNRAISLLCAAGLGGLPQLTMPLGLLDGCPLGLSVVAARGRDVALLELATSLP